MLMLFSSGFPCASPSAVFSSRSLVRTFSYFTCNSFIEFFQSSLCCYRTMFDIFIYAFYVSVTRLLHKERNVLVYTFYTLSAIWCIILVIWYLTLISENGIIFSRILVRFSYNRTSIIYIVSVHRVHLWRWQLPLVFGQRENRFPRFLAPRFGMREIQNSRDPARELQKRKEQWQLFKKKN